MDNTKTTIEKTIQPNTNKVKECKYNIQNLKPFNPNYENTLTTEEAQRRGRNGGIKSGETRKQRKTMKETILSMLSMELSPEKLEDMGVDISTLNGDYTMQGAVISAMLRQAVNGSEKAMQLLRDTIGERPIEETHNINETITADDVSLIDNMKRSLIG